MTPIYGTHNVRPAYQLNWSLSVNWREEWLLDSEWLPELRTSTEADGVRILEHQQTGPQSMFLISTLPNVSLVELVRSVKGRLQYLVRRKIPRAFRRNYSVTSVGGASRDVVDRYVASQVERHPCADPRLQATLAGLQRNYPADLSQMCSTSHGLYLYNLHVVLVNANRDRLHREQELVAFQRCVERTAAKHGERLARIGFVPDHAHWIVGCRPERSPQDVALSYMNNLAYTFGMTALLSHSYYVGTVGEYDRHAIRRRL